MCKGSTLYYCSSFLSGCGGGGEKFCDFLFVSSDQIASQGVHCLLLHLQFLDAVPYCNLPNCFIFRTVMLINLGIQFLDVLR